MILSSCQIYVLGRGFIPALDVTPGDVVVSLAGKRTENVEVTSVESRFVNTRANYVDSGQHNVSTTDDALFLYHSETKGTRYVRFPEISKITPNKEAKETDFLPILSYLHSDGGRNLTDDEAEYLARVVATERWSYDRQEFFSLSSLCTGEDALAFNHFLEHWASQSPGSGWFGRANVKARMVKIADKELIREVARLAVYAGYTCTFIDIGTTAININYASMPAPGSRPKNEKYKRRHYRGNVVNINAQNRPLLGISDTNRCFYLPCSSTLNLA